MVDGLELGGAHPQFHLGDGEQRVEVLGVDGHEDRKFKRYGVAQGCPVEARDIFVIVPSLHHREAFRDTHLDRFADQAEGRAAQIERDRLRPQGRGGREQQEKAEQHRA